jgi:hypothetical protein
MRTFFWFYLVTLWAMLWSFPSVSQTNAAPLSGRKIHLVIVGVTHFAIPDYNNDVLTLAFDQRCNDIKTFFEDHLGVENVATHYFCTPDQTTRELLRHFFSIELPEFSAGTLTLVFIMSHGETATFDNQFLSSDVEIITSDTKATNAITDPDKQREFSSVLLGSELLSWMGRAPAGSTILTFVDTCHSGAAASLSTSVSQFLQQQFGLESLVVASSLKGDMTYSASFTKALLDVWGKDNCLDVDSLSDKIYAEMQTLAPITGSEGIPTVPVRYNGPLCLGNFGTDHRLLFIYAGQDAERNPYRYSLTENAPTGNVQVIGTRSLQYTYVPIPLDAKKYTLAVDRDPDVHDTFTVDLTSANHQMIWLDSSVAPEEVGQAAETLATVAEVNGSPESEVTQIRQGAVALYRAIGQNVDAVRVLSKMQARGEALPISEEVQQVAFQSTQTVRQAVTNLHLQPDVAARELQALGDFKNAGVLWHDAADKQADAGTKAAYAEKAFTALGAAGDTTSAKALEKEYPHVKVGAANAGTADANFQGVEMLKELGAQVAIQSTTPR